MAGVVRAYPIAHFCSFTRGTGYGTHTAAAAWTDTASGDCSTYCDDLDAALDETNYATARSSATAGQVNDGRFEWTFGDLPPNFTFGTLTLIAWVRTSNGGAAAIDSSPTVRFFVDPGTGTRDYDSAGDITVTAARNRNTEAPTGSFQRITGSWASKPGGGAWTRSELLSGSFKAGLESDSSGSYGSGIDATTGGSSASFDVASFYVEVQVTPTGLYVEPVRTVLSHVLRLFRRPIRLLEIDVPIRFADVEPGDTVWSAHDLLPWSPGYEAWEQVPLFVVGVTDRLEPPHITLSCLDLREAYCSFYSPFRVLGVDDQKTGLARLDLGGGWATDRNQVAFAQRPTDDIWLEVAANTARLGKDGLTIVGGSLDGVLLEDTNLLLNSTFSEGSGTTFTSWTNVTTGAGALAEDIADYLIDSPGYQRSIVCSTAAASESAYVAQTVSMGASEKFYVRQLYGSAGATDDHFIQIYRVVGGTGNYWNDTTDAWQAGAYSIRPVVSADGDYISEWIDFGAGSGTLSIYTGYLAALVTGANEMHIYSTEVYRCTKSWHSARPLLPTTSAAVSRLRDYTYADNSADWRAWSPNRGYIRFDYTPIWSHIYLADGDDMPIVVAAHDGDTGSEQHVIGYHRTDASNGYWYFDGAQYALTSGFPVVGTKYSIGARWTSAAVDEFDVAGQAKAIWINGTVGGTTTTGGTEPVPDENARVYFGSDPATETFGDGHFTNLEIGSRCPTDAEMVRLTATNYYVPLPD